MSEQELKHRQLHYRCLANTTKQLQRDWLACNCWQGLWQSIHILTLHHPELVSTSSFYYAWQLNHIL